MKPRELRESQPELSALLLSSPTQLKLCEGDEGDGFNKDVFEHGYFNKIFAAADIFIHIFDIDND